MDWIHCNSCFLQPGETKGMQYMLTDCGHIYCGNCLNPGSKGQCKICKNTCSTIPLSSEMMPDVREYFTGVDEWLNKLLEILAFQNGHRLRLVAYNQAVGKKYKNLKEENRKLKEIIQALQRKTKELEKELQTVKRKLSRPPSVNESGHSSNFFLTPSTPASSKSLNNSPHFPGLSPESPRSPSPQHSRHT
ncbi:probable E3 SUMO-protein ligase RNF212 [Anabrus simplex]|uniref:probable E3 SUMO-protein ligase RNF212 n=1 Tax=Anabrus simplex TaxID=316456 RepID=UPI0034DCE870